LSVTLVVSAASASMACNSGQTKSPSVGLTEPIRPPKFPDQGRGAPRVETDTLYSMYLTPGIRSVCAGPAPFFRFDSARTAKADPTLQTLANCMKDGALKGKGIRLIGRADPRGTEEYNEKLGLERAKSVKDYLVKAGVEEARIETLSRGKEDASPDPEDWPKDRRVQIELAD
jgi:peptidoglycan-associated lipoprotein